MMNYQQFHLLFLFEMSYHPQICKISSRQLKIKMLCKCNKFLISQNNITKNLNMTLFSTDLSQIYMICKQQACPQFNLLILLMSLYIIKFKTKCYQALHYINRMREKRQRKPKKNLDQFVPTTSEPKKKGIRKTSRRSKNNDGQESYDEQQLQLGIKEQTKNTKKKAKKSPIKSNDEPLQLDMEQVEQNNEIIQRDQGGLQGPLNSLAKLNENFKETKALYEQNLAKYNYHRAECQQLSQKVKQSNASIEKKAKQLKQLSRSIYLESVKKIREDFLDSRTFSDENRFNDFITGMKKFVEIKANCPYQDPFEYLKMIKVVPDQLLSNKKPSVRQHKKDLVIRDHFFNFPYLTIGQEHIPLIQALITSTKYLQPTSSTPAQLFPCLFIRQTSLSYSIQQKSISLLYKLITEQDIGLAKAISSLVNEKKSYFTPNVELVQDLLFKGLSMTKFVSFPEIMFQLRSFSYQHFMYVNTYYIEADLSISRQIKIAYCVLVAIRQLANYVEKTIIYSLDRTEEDVGKNIRQIRQRSDVGAKLQQLLTKRKGFVCASNEDYYNLCSQFIFVQNLGHNSSQFENCYMFEEERKRKHEMTGDLLQKYKKSCYSSKNLISEKDEKLQGQYKERQVIDLIPPNLSNNCQQKLKAQGEKMCNDKIGVEYQGQIQVEEQDLEYKVDIYERQDAQRENQQESKCQQTIQVLMPLDGNTMRRRNLR